MPASIRHSPLIALKRAHVALPDDRVSIGWLYEQFDDHAAYLIIFVLALLGALPAASLPAGLAICVLSAQMIVSRHGAPIPAAIASREIASRPARYALARAISVLHACDRVFPAAANAAMARARPFAGVLLFALGATLLIPIPLSNVVPALAAAAVALAMIEGSLLLLVLSSFSAVASFALMAATVSAAGTLLRF